MKIKYCYLTSILSGLLLSSALASDEASGPLKWAGTVPLSGSDGAIQILNKGDRPFDAGRLIIKETAAGSGEYVISSSSSLTFWGGVVFPGNPPQDLGIMDYEVKSMNYSQAGGLMPPVDANNPEFMLTANGTKLTGKVVGETEHVRLNVVTPQPLTTLKPSDEIVVMSVIHVTNARI